MSYGEQEIENITRPTDPGIQWETGPMATSFFCCFSLSSFFVLIVCSIKVLFEKALIDFTFTKSRPVLAWDGNSREMMKTLRMHTFRVFLDSAQEKLFALLHRHVIIMSL